MLKKEKKSDSYMYLNNVGTVYFATYKKAYIRNLMSYINPIILMSRYVTGISLFHGSIIFWLSPIPLL